MAKAIDQAKTYLTPQIVTGEREKKKSQKDIEERTIQADAKIMKKGIITYENKIATLNNTIAEKEKKLIGKRKCR